MDPFRLCLVLGPMALYLLLIGVINLGKRPFLISGTRDTAVLAMAMAGLVIVGPIELLIPPMAAVRFGAYLWLFLAGLFGSGLSLLLLMLRPRFVLYNITLDQLRPMLAEMVPQLDLEARWAGDCLSLPTLGVQLYVDHVPALRNVSLVAAGPQQNAAGWRQFEAALAAAVRNTEVPRNPYGYNLLTTSLIMICVLGFFVAKDPSSLTQSLKEMLNL